MRLQASGVPTEPPFVMKVQPRQLAVQDAPVRHAQLLAPGDEQPRRAEEAEDPVGRLTADDPDGLGRVRTDDTAGPAEERRQLPARAAGADPCRVDLDEKNASPIGSRQPPFGGRPRPRWPRPKALAASSIW